MSDDLISRKALLEILNKRLADYSCDSNSGAQRIADIYKCELIPVVENAPTAFDKEKVIEELKHEEELAENAIVKLEKDMYANPDILQRAMELRKLSLAYCKSINIVEKGGIE